MPSSERAIFFIYQKEWSASFNLDVQLPQLFRIDRRRRGRHQVGCRGRLREGNDLANRALVREDGRDAIEAQGDPPVRRRAVFERLEEKAEAELRLVLADVQQRENAAL